MIIGIMGDCHLTNKRPERRLDDYLLTQQGKFRGALEIFNMNACECVVQPGDLIDSPDVSNIVKSFIIETLKQYHIKLEMVFGQHSVYGHSKETLPSSTLSVLRSAGVIHLLSDEWYCGGHDGEVSICLYGANFGESVPSPIEPDAYNVLVIHAMIGNRQLYPGQELANPKQFLRKHQNYKLVVCGDYHYRFIETFEGRTILNAGALVRKTISEFDLEHKPAVVIFDTLTNKAEFIELKIRPVEEVFDLSPAKKSNSESLNKFMEGLKSNDSFGGGKLNTRWKEILAGVLKERKANEEVRKIIDQSLEEANAK